MRTRNWLSRLLGGMLALAAGTESLWAQQGPEGAYFYDGPPGYTGGYTGMESAGYPPGAQPWPGVSPYMGPAVDQTRYENGTWFRQQSFGGRKYFFGLEALVTQTGKPPQSWIGASGVNIIQGYPGTTYPFHNQMFYEGPFTATPGPDRSNEGTGGGGGNNTTTGDLQVFPNENIGIINESLLAGGLRGRWGFWNPDDTGFVVSGFWTDKSQADMILADPELILDPFAFNNQAAVAAAGQTVSSYSEHLHAWMGLPLQGLDTDLDGQPGVVIPFDISVYLQLKSQLYGANANYYFNSFISGDSIKLRGLAGGRYLNLGEDFQFVGIDSGMGYTIQNATATTGTGGGGTGGQQFSSQIGTPTALEPGWNVPDVMKSYLRSNLRSQLGGPEIGIRMDLGDDDDGFSIWTETKFGLLANNARRFVEGYNIGDGFFYIPGTTFQNNNTLVTYDAQGVPSVGGSGTIMPRHDIALTKFRDESTTTYISPMFEQSINAKTKIFSYIPGFRKLRVFNEASFQIGYTFLLIGGVYRPSDNINWDAYPVNPSLANNRTKYYTNNLSLGFEWNY